MRSRLHVCVIGPWLQVLALLAFGVPGLAQKNKPIFDLDLQSYGYRFQYGKDDRFENFTDVAFPSDDLVLVSVKELSLDELRPQVLPLGTLTYVNPAGARTPPTSLSRLLLFSLPQKTLVQSAALPVRKVDGAVQATANGHFLMLSSYGLHLCSAELRELKCGPARPTDGPVRISPQGNRTIMGGFQFTEQRLIDAGSFSDLETFKPGSPEVVPGDVGLLLVGDQHTLLRMPSGKDLDLGLAEGVFPTSRFLDLDKVVGIRMLSISKGKAIVLKVDGTVLYQIDVEEAWRGNTRFVPSNSGLRFCVAELYYTRLNSIINLFDIADSRAYNRARIRVFETASGKQLFELQWDPRRYRGERILPALSPSGHRLAIVQKGRLQVYEVP